MPSPFAGLGLPIDAPARCMLLHPVTGAPFMVTDLPGDTGKKSAPQQAYVEVLSWHSRPAQAHRFLVEDKLRRTNAPMGSEESYNDMGEMLARMTTGWLLADLHGKHLAVEPAFDMARELYNGLETRWLRNQVLEFVNNQGNFPAAG